MKKIVVCDFDGTITKQDSLDIFLNRYAKPEWHILEKEWLEGRIGSRACIRKQFDLIEGMTEEEMSNFLDSVEIDEYFESFYQFAQEKGIKVAVVSDGFDLIIDTLLKKHGLDEIDVYTNHLELKNGEFIMEFPNISTNCKKASGTCKCTILKEITKDYDKVFYVGDGISDFCVSDKADFVFAKKRLLKYCQENQIPCFEYQTFKDVMENEEINS